MRAMGSGRSRCQAAIVALAILWGLLCGGCHPPLWDGALACEPDEPRSCPDGFFCQLRQGVTEYRCYREAGEFCGDGRIGAGELCDGEFLAGRRCQDHGRFAGTLRCDARCQLDLSGCVTLTVVEAGYGQVCGLDTAGGAWCWGTSATESWPGGAVAEPWVPTPIPTPASLQMLTVGGGHACGLDESGRALCWGHNPSGQLGGGAAQTGVYSPGRVEQVWGDVRFTTLTAGWDHTCGLSTAQQTWCWGRDHAGQLGDGGGADWLVPREVSGVPPLGALAAGGVHTCGLDGDGAIWCWGGNDFGQLGVGTATSGSTPLAADAPSGFRTIVSGGYHSCSLDGAGVAWCWGLGHAGQLEAGEMRWTRPTPLSTSRRFTALAAGAFHTCGVTAPGEVSCWGLGYGTPDGSGAVSVSASDPVGSLSAGWTATCGVGLEDGLPRCWGLNGAGQLGADPRTAVPQPVATEARFTGIATGGAMSCGVDANGLGWCWGRAGQLGSAEYRPRLTPTRVAQAVDDIFVALRAGHDFACGLTTQGGLRCWGSDAAGQLGDGSGYSPYGEPVSVEGSRTMATLAVGAEHACAADTTDRVFCWGANDYGQLGTGDTANRAEPSPVQGGHRFVAVAAGRNHSCAIDRDGALYCWGANWKGQLGDGTNQASLVPVAVIGGNRFTAVVAGGAHTCALDDVGLAWCWGFGDLGATGGDLLMDSNFPRPVVGEQRWARITAGFGHTCGISAEGETFCWGHGRFGQVGDGQRAPRFRPTAVAAELRLVEIRAGATADHTCGLDEAGQAWCWGRGIDGQLGVSVPELTPRVITAP